MYVKHILQKIVMNQKNIQETIIKQYKTTWKKPGLTAISQQFFSIFCYFFLSFLAISPRGSPPLSLVRALKEKLFNYFFGGEIYYLGQSELCFLQLLYV